MRLKLIEHLLLGLHIGRSETVKVLFHNDLVSTRMTVLNPFEHLRVVRFQVLT